MRDVSHHPEREFKMKNVIRIARNRSFSLKITIRVSWIALSK